MPNTSESRKRRLKQKDLVTSIFRIFADEFENSEAQSIREIILPMDRIKQLMHERHNIDYRSNHWIYTQLKRYEEDLGERLFRKVGSAEKGAHDFKLAIFDDLITFTQKKHLYISGKIKIANGVIDIIRNRFHGRSPTRNLVLLLGAGSSMYHIAEILGSYSKDVDHGIQVYTHNLGVIERLMASDIDRTKIDVFIPGGRIDPVTHCIVSSDTGFFTDVDFDFIIQGTSVVNGGHLYVESRSEIALKKAILKKCRGDKILVLTKHECRKEALEGASYGEITDYDYVVVPKFQMSRSWKKEYEVEFDEYRPLFQPMIINWNYEILVSEEPARISPRRIPRNS